jgi:hypothetical protein
MERKPRLGALVRIDEEALAAFRKDLRRRYTDEEILAQLVGCARRLERSPTMREFDTDPATTIHPQTVVERFGTWNNAKRRAGLPPRRFATRTDLLLLLRELGDELGRIPTARDLEARRGRMPSKSLYWHTFGSLRAALREAGFDVPVGDERLERAVAQGTALARRLRRLPRFADWAQARKQDPAMLTEWQVYRMAGAGRGTWSTFQFLVRQRLLDAGVEILPDGTLGER